MRGVQQRIAYMPGLDGIRALAVVAVVLFHSGYGWARGGFIGVSLFFTLSGYLITSLLLAEHTTEGRVALRSFYARRARRLLPASLLCLVLVLVAAPWWSDSQLRRLPGDALAALANIANWRFAFAGTSYRDLFDQTPSPVAHFWSLSIEEQCYLVVPVVVVLGLRAGRRLLPIVLGVLTVASVVAAVLTLDFDVAYNGTHTRAAELLVGALAAALLGPGRASGRGAPRLLQGAGVVALVGFIGAVLWLSLEDRWPVRGGLAAFALAWVVLIRAASIGPLGAVLGWSPLAWIGRMSYGIYLFHWPVFLLMTPARTGLDGAGLLAVRMAVVLTVTVVSAKLIEQPIRGRTLLRRPALAGTALGAASVAIVALAVSAVPTPQRTATEELLDQGAAGVLDFSTASPISSPSPTTPPPPPPMRLLLLGSETLSTAGLPANQFEITDAVDPRCPIATGVETRLADGSVVPIARCRAPESTWPALIERVDPDVVVVSLGPLDSGTVRRADQIGFPPPSDLQAFGERIRASGEDLDVALAMAGAGGREVVVVDHGVAEWLRKTVERAVLESNRARVIAPRAFVASMQALRTSELAEASAETLAAARLLVIGDSTSLIVARALHDASDGRLVVRWAGAEGCPFVETTAIRSAATADWEPTTCEPFRTRLPAILETFEPDAVLLVAGAMEMLEQQYPGDPIGHLPGSATYVARHDSEMAAFLTMLEPYGVPLFVADAPPLLAGVFVTAEMTEPARLAAWNEQITRWDERFDEVQVLSYAGPLLAYEAANGVIRTDGSHPELEPLTEIARASLVGPVLRMIGWGIDP